MLIVDISFKNVFFGYKAYNPVLKDVSFDIKAGEMIGIVGHSGAGKSTLINLLMRYYDEYDGEILVDGVNVRDIDMKYYRNSIGFVQQEPLMFRDTIFNSIAYGSNISHVEQVLHAAEVANAHGFISKLPDAYDTKIGFGYKDLSGGEKQRLSFPRKPRNLHRREPQGHQRCIEQRLHTTCIDVRTEAYNR